MVGMIKTMLPRLLLLLLLAVDWVSDPYCGASPLSAPLSSQVAVDETIGIRPKLFDQEFALFTIAAPGFLENKPLVASPFSFPIEALSFFASAGTNRIYIFMSIQR